MGNLLCQYCGKETELHLFCIKEPANRAVIGFILGVTLGVGYLVLMPTLAPILVNALELFL